MGSGFPRGGGAIWKTDPRVAHSCATQIFVGSFYRRKSPPHAKFVGEYGGSVRIFWFPRGGRKGPEKRS